MREYKAYEKYKASALEWAEKIPEHWELRRLKFVAQLRYGDSLPSESRDDGKIPVFGSNGEVGSHSSSNTLAPCIIVGRKGSYGKVTFSESCAFAIDTTYFIDASTIQTSVHFRWLYYALSILGLDLFSQDTGVPGLSREFAHNRPLIFPPLDEQKLIARFLDRETTRIDTLITKKRQLIDLLQKKRSSIINEAVTKGLNSRVDLKNSRISFIGEMPKHWKAIRLKFVVTHIVDCLHSTPRYNENGDYPAIRTADINPGILDIENANRVTLEDYLERIARLKPEAQDIIYSREGERFGMAALVPEEVDLCLAQRVMMFRVENWIDPTFFMWVLNADCMYHQVKQDTVGATSPRVNIGTVVEAWLPIPPKDEQEEISLKISESCQKVDKIISRVQEHVSLIEKFRHSLITNSVTGKIDVHEEID